MWAPHLTEHVIIHFIILRAQTFLWYYCRDCNDTCLNGKFSIVAGAHNRRLWEETKQTRKVRRCACHELYKGEILHDIAMLALDSSLSINDGSPVNAIELATKPVPYGTSCKLTGWGALSVVAEYGKASPIETFRNVTLTYISWHHHTNCNLK